MDARVAKKPMVFVSHVHEDADWAKPVQTWLNDNLNSALEFFNAADPWSLKPGDDWPTTVFRALRRSALMLSFMSPSSLDRRWLLFEAGAGCGRGISVIPLCIKGVSVRQLTPPISFYQALELPSPTEERKLLDRVAEAVSLKVLRAPTRLIVPRGSLPSPPSPKKLPWRPHP
jgi:hypothetical protein